MVHFLLCLCWLHPIYRVLSREHTSFLRRLVAQEYLLSNMVNNIRHLMCEKILYILAYISLDKKNNINLIIMILMCRILHISTLSQIYVYFHASCRQIFISNEIWFRGKDFCFYWYSFNSFEYVFLPIKMIHGKRCSQVKGNLTFQLIK